MLAFTARTFLKQNEEARTRPLSRFVEVVEPAASTGTLHPAPVDQAQASLFEKIFKEEITGVEVLHSQSERAQYLNRYGALGITSPPLKRWLDRWIRGGGVALR